MEREKSRIDRQITLIKSMLNGRGVGAVQDTVLNSLGEKAQDALDAYLI
jgi:hypothetical protein